MAKLSMLDNYVPWKQEQELTIYLRSVQNIVQYE